MHPSKPNFLYVLLCIVRRTEQVLPKERSALVDRHSVPNEVQVGVVRRFSAWEVCNVVDPAHRANGVPDSNEMRLAFAAKGFVEVRGHGEVDLLALNHPN